MTERADGAPADDGAGFELPLLLFAAGTRRINLTVIGMIQFVTPVMQFILGAVVLGEPMPPERWVGFGLVWLALIVLTVDLILGVHASRRVIAEPA